MEVIGFEAGCRFGSVEVEIQRIDWLDLEQSKNLRGNVIHSMGTRCSAGKILTGPGASGAA